MTEHELHGMWASARRHLIASQLAPTLLLAATIFLVLSGLGIAPAALKVATVLVLLSSGILGALVQISAAGEARAIAADLARLENRSAVSERVIASARWTLVVTRVTPVIFVLTYVVLLWAIFVSPAVGI